MSNNPNGYYFTHDTPHRRTNDGHQRPYRPQGSWYEIENGTGWAEYRQGTGGGLGSDRHSDRLLDGMGWAGAIAFTVIPSLAYPPLAVILVPMLILSAISHLIDAMASTEDRLRARDAADAARRAQMPHPAPTVARAFSGPPNYPKVTK